MIVFYRAKLLALLLGFFRGERAALLYALWVFVSMIPAGAMYVWKGDAVETAYGSPLAVSVLLMVTGAALHLDREHLAQAFRALIVGDAQPALVMEWAELMERLMGEEREALRKLEQEELRQALEGQSESFYTLWDSRN